MTRKMARNGLLYILLLLLAIESLFPFIWLLGVSFNSSLADVFNFPPQIMPKHPTFANYLYVIAEIPFLRYGLNSLVVSTSVVLLNLLIGSLAAYPLARWNFPFRDAIFFIILGTMAIPFEVTLVPLFVIAHNLHLSNTYLGLILPPAISGLTIFILRQGFLSVPGELEHAARIDGAGPFRIWWSIMVPLITPSMATVAILTFVAQWGNLLWPLVVVSKDSLYTLPVGLAYLQGFFSSNWLYISAGSVMATVPIIIVFLFAQRYYIPNMEGGTKE